ncbi:DUF389 domain-containing protein [Arthrobacter sp. 35W]|uniref:DUF389 domain-containing protein n=1 Tax=Arthrobacter sp. 35W TaxID=1132441 RepID=UPI000422780D|nr:DUF389 domain-containing protein [Arthrobacter sp. 35W]
MTLQVRVVVPAGLTADIVSAARGLSGVSEISVLTGASVLPPGDIITLAAERECVAELLELLHGFQVAEVGSVSISEPELVLSTRARQASEQTPGEGADAIIWDEVETNTSEEAKLSWSFLAFLVIATQLAGIGIVTDSTIAIVGAMVVGPEFGPLAGLALALVDRRWALARRAAVALGVGFPVAMGIAALATWLSIPLGLVDPGFLSKGDPATEFIYHPGPYSFIVAVLAGAAGMLSLIGRKSAVLVGVFISVTTVPAAGFVAVALVLNEPALAAGSAIQLLLNLSGIVVSAAAVLAVYRWLGRHRSSAPASPYAANPFKRQQPVKRQPPRSQRPSKGR